MDFTRDTELCSQMGGYETGEYGSEFETHVKTFTNELAWRWKSAAHSVNKTWLRGRVDVCP